MKRWQYWINTIDLFEDSGSDDVSDCETLFDEDGKYGWELVSVVVRGRTMFGFFKREVPNE